MQKSTRSLPIMEFGSITQKSGRYVNQDIPLTGLASNSITLTGSTSQNLLFQLPDSVYNLSKSTITYNYQVVAPASTYFNAYEDLLGLEIAQTLTFYPNQGTNIVSLTNPALYGKVIPKLDTRQSKYFASDDTTGLHLPNGSVNPLPVAWTLPAGNSYSLPAAATYNATSVNQPTYLRVPPTGTAVAATYNVSPVIPLGQLTGTIFALKHEQYFGGQMNLNIATAPTTNFGFTTTAIYTGSGAPAGAAALPNNQVITLSGVYLNLAVQDDLSLSGYVIEMFRSGKLSYQVPYVTTTNTVLNGTGQLSSNIPLSSAFGRKLKRVVNSVVLSSPPVGGQFDISNPSGSKFTWFGTSMNSNQLQRKTQNNCVIASTANPSNVLDDYRENKRFLEDSCLQDAMAYQYNWFHCDSFSDRSNIPWSLSSDQIDEGLVLGLGNSNYQFTAYTTAALSVWSFIETVREVAITEQGPVWVM